MANRTQIRLQQLTGSFGTQSGMINDQLSQAATGSIAAADFGTVVNHLASAIKRINGADSFSEQVIGTFTHPTATFSGDIRLNGNDIQASDGVASISMSGRDVSVAGDLTVTGNDIKGSGGTVMTMDGSNNAAFAADVEILGGDATIKAANDGNATLNLQADNADDNGDSWLMAAQASQTLTLANNISGSPVGMLNITPHATSTNSLVEVAGKLKLSGLEIQNADGEACINIDADQNATVAADLTVSGGKVTLTNGATIDSETAGELILTEDKVVVSDEIKVVGNIISGSAGLNMTLGNAGLVTVAGDITVSGGKMTLTNGATVDSETAGKLKLTEDLVECSADLTVLGNDLDFAAGNAQLGASVGANTLSLGGSSSTVAALGTLRVDGNITADGNEAKSIFAEVTSNNITLGGGGTVVAAGNLQVNGTAIDVDSASALNIGASVGANNLTIGAATSTVVVPGSQRIEGDLTVQGTTTSVDSVNLLVKDPVIAMGAGNNVANSNGGLAIISGSAAGTDLVFGRIANDTLAVGILDSQSGSVSSVAGMAVTNFRAGVLEVAGATNYLDINSTNLRMVAAQDIVLDPAGGDVKVDGDMIPNSAGGGALGEAGAEWSNLFLNAAGKVDFANGDITVTHAPGSGGRLTFAGAADRYQFSDGPVRVPRLQIDSGADYIDLVGLDLNLVAGADLVLGAGGGQAYVAADLLPSSSNNKALGSNALPWSDAFLGTGGVLNFSNGDFTLTHTAGRLSLANGKQLAFGDAGEAIWGDGTNLFVSSSGDINLIARDGDVSFLGAGALPATNWSRASANTQYFNFSTDDSSNITIGATGFGIRNNNGTMQFKNNGGSWTTFGAGANADKQTLQVTGSGVPSGERAHINKPNGFDVSAIPVADRLERIDCYVNGQLLLSGANADYIMDEIDGADKADVRVQFALVADDVLTVVVR